MNKYPNFKKYFNTNPRLWLGLWLAIYEAIIVGAIILSIYAGKFFFLELAYAQICCILIPGMLYHRQLTLVKAYIGKNLKRRGYDVEQALDEIEAELENPAFAQIHSGINRSMNFIITRNWIVGTDDLLAMRANAVRISDIVSVDLNEIDTYSVSQGTARHHVRTKHYFRVKFSDKNNRIYCFSVRNEKCQREAYDYIVNNIVG